MKIKGFTLVELLVVMAVIGMLAGTPAFAGMGMSKNSSATTSAGCSVIFPPQNGQTTITEMDTSCDVALGTVTIYAKSGVGRVPVADTNGSTTVVDVLNTSYGLTNGNSVVYVYASGAVPVYRTISSATTSNVTLNTAVTQPVKGDLIYKVAISDVKVVADNTAAAGTNKLDRLSPTVFVSPSDSPLYIVMQSATNANLSVTVQ